MRKRVVGKSSKYPYVYYPEVMDVSKRIGNRVRKSIEDVLKEFPETRKIYLIGSRATDKYRQREKFRNKDIIPTKEMSKSDIDILVSGVKTYKSDYPFGYLRSIYLGDNQQVDIFRGRKKSKFPYDILVRKRKK